MSAYAKYEDGVLRKVFACTLDPAQADPGASPPLLYLDELAKVRGGGWGGAP